MVAHLDRLFWISVVITAISIVMLIVATGSYKKNKWVVIASLVLPIIFWFAFNLKRNSIIQKAKVYMHPIELANYNNKIGCILLVKYDITYTIKCNKELIKTGTWDLHVGKQNILLLDDKIFGLNELRVK
jgi:hypothetical protein